MLIRLACFVIPIYFEAARECSWNRRSVELEEETDRQRDGERQRQREREPQRTKRKRKIVEMRGGFIRLETIHWDKFSNLCDVCVYIVQFGAI